MDWFTAVHAVPLNPYPHRIRVKTAEINLKLKYVLLATSLNLRFAEM